MRSSFRTDIGEHRDTIVRLASASRPRCPHPQCRELCWDAVALERHVRTVHPPFPPADEECSE